MNYKTDILVGEVTDLSFARYYAGMMINKISFLVNIYQNEKGINIADYQDITKWISGIDIGITVNFNQQLDLSSLELNYKYDFLHIIISTLNTELLQSLGNLNSPYFAELLIDNDLEINEITKKIIEKQKHNPILGIIISGKISELKNVKKLANDNKIPIYRNLEDDVAIDDKIKGFDGTYIKSSRENSVGIADFDKIDSVLASLEVN